MAHIRPRYLEPVVRKALGLSPIVGVLGHRQVGKTTLLASIAESYESFDDATILEMGLIDPRGYLASRDVFPAAIDECQLVPGLFPALKEQVRKRQRPGQFLLSGSIRFTSRKAIRESLTGRIINFDLLPFSIPELEGAPLSDFGPRSLSVPEFSEDWLDAQTHLKKPARRLSTERYLESGGLPGVCFIRESSFRDKKIQEQLLTLLDRDLRLVTPTTLSYRQILEFVRTLALLEGQPIRASDLKRKTNIAPVTQKKLLQALESIFILRLLPIEGTSTAYTVLFEDQAESFFLTEGRLPKMLQFSSLVWRNVRTQWGYRIGSEPRFFQFRTRGGAHVPLVVRSGNSVLGLIPFSGDAPDRSSVASMGSLFKAHMGSKAILYSVDHPIRPRVRDSRTLILPLSALL